MSDETIPLSPSGRAYQSVADAHGLAVLYRVSDSWERSDLTNRIEALLRHALLQAEVEALEPTPLLSVREVAKLIGKSEQRIYQMIQRGEVPAAQVGGRVMVTRAAYDRWLDDLTAAGMANLKVDG